MTMRGSMCKLMKLRSPSRDSCWTGGWFIVKRSTGKQSGLVA